MIQKMKDLLFRALADDGGMAEAHEDLLRKYREEILKKKEMDIDEMLSRHDKAIREAEAPTAPDEPNTFLDDLKKL